MYGMRIAEAWRDASMGDNFEGRVIKLMKTLERYKCMGCRLHQVIIFDLSSE